MKPYKAKTNKEIFDEDAQTATALGIKPIPKDTVVDVIGLFENQRGSYVKVKYKGYIYYTKAAYLNRI